MNLRYIDWIWRVRGSLALAPGQSSGEAIDSLAPLFRQPGTSHERSSDSLTFKKKDPAAQDKMSVFESGSLHIAKTTAGSMLSYELKSRTLLMCFLAPFFFLGAAQLVLYLNKFEKPPAAAEKKKEVIYPMNPVDKFLGAPAPETKKKDKGDDDEGGGRKGKKLSATPAYVFAGIFTALYLIGRVLEDWLMRRLFRKALTGSLDEAAPLHTDQVARGAA